MLSLPAVVLSEPSPRDVPAPGLPLPRKLSPSTGSTLITRAPRSARTVVAKGTATTDANSSTVTPSRGGAPEGSPGSAAGGAAGRSRHAASWCSPGSACQSAGAPGVSGSDASGPSCLVSPSRGERSVTTSPLWTICG